MIEHEALPEVASQLYRDVIKEEQLKPIGEPVIVDMDYKRGEAFRVRIRYDIRPTFTLKDYKGIPAEKPVHTVTDAEVAEEIVRLQKMNSTTEEAESVTHDEFVVTAQVQELDKTGVPIIGKKTKDARFYLADPSLEQPIRDVLRKAQRGNDYQVAFQHKHDEHTHDVNLRISASKIERVILPEFNDEFVKTVTKGKVASAEEFKAKLRTDLEEYWTEKSRRHVVNMIVGEIVRRHDFQVPESLIRSVLEGLLEEVKAQYPNKQLPPDFDGERFFQENRAYAIYQSKWALIREEIIKAEGITSDEKDLEALAGKEAGRIGIDKQRLVEYYKSSDQIKDRLVSDKIIGFLVSQAKITEVPHTETETQART